MTERVVVVCPGRGSYTEGELGWLSRHYCPPQARQELDAAIDRFDAQRQAGGDLGIREMDASERFSARLLKGENASPLIFACTALDFARLDPDKCRVVGVLGNSMGWYSSLYCAGVFGPDDALNIIETMGGSQRAGITGGQLMYPLVRHRDWQHDPEQETQLRAGLASVRAVGHRVGVSIKLGGFAVLWGDEQGIRSLLEELPMVKMGGREYPFRLLFHAAFHSPLLNQVSRMGLEQLIDLPWRAPSIPLIDGRGSQFRPLLTAPDALYKYTLGNQVTDTYDFSASIRTAVREYAPDRIVLLGPGEGLGGAIAHVLIKEKWQGIRNKQDFFARQKNDPFLISMARENQAALVATQG